MKNIKKVWLISILFMLMVCMTGCADSNATPEIKTQPADVHVSYPDSATFKVEVTNKNAVESYQWVMVDKVGTEFVMEGLTAKSDTLVLPSTQQNFEASFYCIITGKNKEEVISDSAELVIENNEENKPVLYVGEYAVQPGGSLNLSETMINKTTPLGSGEVSFAENGTDITFKNVNYNNDFYSADYLIAPNVGISLVYYNNPVEEYNVTFEGENIITNNYYDEEYNAAGIPLDFLLYGQGAFEKPLINLIGDGNLTITNGTICLRAIADLDIGVDINIRETTPHYSDAINAKNIKIEKGTNLDIVCNGTALYADGNLYSDGANINICSYAPKVSVGVSVKNIIQSNLTVYLLDTIANIKLVADQEQCTMTAGDTGISALTELYIKNSEVNYEVEVNQGDSLYASNFIGFTGSYGSIENSKVSIKMDCPELFYGIGMYFDTDVEITNSDVDVFINSDGPALGIAPEGDFNAVDSNVEVLVSNSDKYGEGATGGVMCSNFVALISDPKYTVHSKAIDGMAVGCKLEDELTTDVLEYTSGYTSKNVFLREGTLCTLPENYAVSTGSFYQGDVFYSSVETFYDKTDTSKPASEVIVTIK